MTPGPDNPLVLNPQETQVPACAGGDPERPMQPLPARREAEAALEAAMLSLADAPCKSAEQLRDLLASQLGLQARSHCPLPPCHLPGSPGSFPACGFFPIVRAKRERESAWHCTCGTLSVLRA